MSVAVVVRTDSLLSYAALMTHARHKRLEILALVGPQAPPRAVPVAAPAPPSVPKVAAVAPASDMADSLKPKQSAPRGRAKKTVELKQLETFVATSGEFSAQTSAPAPAPAPAPAVASPAPPPADKLSRAQVNQVLNALMQAYFGTAQ
jgi:hypothetical protein